MFTSQGYMSLIGAYPTVECFKKFSIGKDTLSKYLRSVLPYLFPSHYINNNYNASLSTLNT